MPRHSDPELEGRILNAARKLWHKGGETALSMRAVAKAAGTNTPAVYRRFRTREQILRALVQSYQQQLYQELVDCRSLAQVAERALKFALGNPREYQLINSGLLARMTKERPNFDFVAHRCAEWFGGQARDHEALVFGMWAFMHGTAMLRISGTVQDENASRSRVIFMKSLAVLVKNAEKLRGL
jgi:AcrR family transcriptional regulator